MNTPVRSAVILAAGCGRRLGPRGARLPKGFVCLGERSLIEESVARLEAVGVRRVVVVTGHEAEHYARFAQGRPGVETVFNPRYAVTGSLASLAVALEGLDEDFLLLESDLTYEARGLRALLAYPSRDALLVSGPTGSGDEVYVEAEGDRLVDLSKQRARLGPSVLGEFVGITRVSAALAERLRAVAAALVPREPQADYERALVGAARVQPISLCLVPDLAWSEVDDEGQLLRARVEVYPRVRQRDAGP